MPQGNTWQIIAQWRRPVALREALVVLYWEICAASHQRVHVVIEMASEPHVFFSLSARDKSSRITIS